MPEPALSAESRPAASPGSWTAAASLAVAVVYLAWITACVMGTCFVFWDDNYISYTYSRNLAGGHGLRFNAVDPAPTEGFSSLSHVLLVALTDRLGIDPLAATRGASLLFFVFTPFLVGRRLASLLEVPMITTLAICYAGQILYFLSTASINNLVLGMETIIFMGGLAALAGWSIGELDQPKSTPRSGLWRAVSGCLATTLVALGRPEGPVLVVLTLGTVFAAKRWFFTELRLRVDRPFLAVAAFAALGLSAYFLWKLSCFGYLLPNPYYVKSHNAIMGKRDIGFPGWRFTKEFLGLIWPWVAAGIPLFLVANGSRSVRKALLVAVLPGAALVLAYAKAIHEAAFWYRFEFPYLVYLHLLLAGLVCLAAKRLRVPPLVFVATTVLLVSAIPFNRMLLLEKPTAFLDVKVDTGNDSPVEQMGKDLARTGLGQRATIALSAAGAIPYYSGFRAIDMVGLNDNYLSGRTSHSIAEVWSYIDSFKPDVIQSGLPPATPGIGLEQYDPVLEAPVFSRLDRGEFDEAPKFYDHWKYMMSMRQEMILLRDRYAFGAAYRWSHEWLILYVRRDSPHRPFIQQALDSSVKTDRLTDLRPYFLNDPRQLGAPAESAAR
jgi:hypothetical protein